MRYLKVLLLVVSLSAFTRAAVYAECCSCEVSADRKAAADALVQMSDAQKAQAQSLHFPWGLPKAKAGTPNATVLCLQDYIVGYDEQLRVPVWVGYRLSGADTLVPRARKDCFRQDPRLSAEVSSSCHDYKYPPYQCGHLAPNADFKQTEGAMLNSYFMSNMTPQIGTFNQYIWAWLEEDVRTWAQAEGQVYVITGVVFDKDGNGKRDDEAQIERVNGRVALPTHFYKIIVRKRSSGALNALVMILPHDGVSHKKKDSETYYNQHLATINKIESLTGWDFFPALDKTKQSTLEKSKANKIWMTTSLLPQ